MRRFMEWWKNYFAKQEILVKDYSIWKDIVI